MSTANHKPSAHAFHLLNRIEKYTHVIRSYSLFCESQWYTYTTGEKALLPVHFAEVKSRLKTSHLNCITHYFFRDIQQSSACTAGYAHPQAWFGLFHHPDHCVREFGEISTEIRTPFFLKPHAFLKSSHSSDSKSNTCMQWCRAVLVPSVPLGSSSS